MTLVTDKEILRDNKLAKLGWVLGLFTFVVMLLMPAPQELSSDAWCVAALGILMAILWITEAIPLPATALLPIPLVPLLGVASVKDTVTSYSHPVIFLFMGGFIVALAMERWKLHQRIALLVLKYSSDSPDRLIAGFMAISAFLSMWVSNTATTLMMLPIAVSVVATLKTGHDHNSDLPKALMLALAYGATAGGMATLVGTPPNAFFAGFVKETYGLEVGFLDWMTIALPLSILMLLAIWVLLTKVIFKLSKHSIAGVNELIDSQFRAQGKMTRGEISVGLVFITLATLWILRPWLNSNFPGLKLSDTVIGMSVGLSTFLIPVDWKKGVFVMNWEWGKKIPFGINLIRWWAHTGFVDSENRPFYMDWSTVEWVSNISDISNCIGDGVTCHSPNGVDIEYCDHCNLIAGCRCSSDHTWRTPLNAHHSSDARSKLCIYAAGGHTSQCDSIFCGIFVTKGYDKGWI